MSTDPLDLLGTLIGKARAAGADAADAVYMARTTHGVQVRNGRTEDLERSETSDLGLRVFVGRRSAIVSATSLDPERFDPLVAQALAMARVVPEDPHSGLSPDAVQGFVDAAGMDLLDPAQPDTAALLDRARAAEDAAVSVAGVTNSNGGSASSGLSDIILMTSAGFSGRYARSSHSVSASVLAGQGTGMQRDYDYHATVHLSDLDDPAKIGRSAGEKAVARLNPTRPRTGSMAVVFDPRVSSSLLGHLAGAVNGSAIARGTSFLKDRMGQRIMPAGIHIIDDPTQSRGLSAHPFDGEGMRAGELVIVQDGVLMNWALDSRSARQVGLPGNGRASRGTTAPPGPSLGSLYARPGTVTPAALMADIAEGIYVTELMGSAINGLTGDYSRGASGFMIRGGTLAEPVAELTIAGNLNDMFARMVLADDLVFRRGINAPTIRIDDLMIAGS
ncbi:peptidase U62 modulator of DNA gyrase [Gluconacetobacter diazotrophicus PA1 5]|uniref:Peptidase U62, modulator of DNA gyrase n=2 Tax=Gluconacetobacter diazotrophicus TaxID=33996 RepID=A9HKF2_GLUDA|nr:TldD/PmbA family protein [Gluconacetobacter diazotrophicus]ACI50107.1 peptidase U62 modulator of DNA gyrase [Gluconacetobacter diazotrophicus PA1 5]MBB2158205.1 TldD/PmbA family protein [Gluconacetobacter diazotrophicus]TWB07813.1 PmbA protein [Gluconacetobacter diazotrophicus]CAP56033.1 Peptidase U62, modulator of DNA gyrase [Gluconacetobacter diazotrophicus PA1 5]